MMTVRPGWWEGWQRQGREGWCYTGWELKILVPSLYSFQSAWKVSPFFSHWLPLCIFNLVCFLCYLHYSLMRLLLFFIMVHHRHCYCDLGRIFWSPSLSLLTCKVGITPLWQIIVLKIKWDITLNSPKHYLAYTITQKMVTGNDDFDDI